MSTPPIPKPPIAPAIDAPLDAPSAAAGAGARAVEQGAEVLFSLAVVPEHSPSARAAENPPETQAAGDPALSYQARVSAWLLACFGEAIANDRTERTHRFLEEALELAQACGCTPHEAHQLVDYVYGRPVGEPGQEVGGVMLTVAGLCRANALDMDQCANAELDRVWSKIQTVRAKQAAKTKLSPLPEKLPLLASQTISRAQAIQCATAYVDFADIPEVAKAHIRGLAALLAAAQAPCQ